MIFFLLLDMARCFLSLKMIVDSEAVVITYFSSSVDLFM